MSHPNQRSSHPYPFLCFLDSCFIRTPSWSRIHPSFTFTIFHDSRGAISYDSCHSVLCLYVARHDGPVGCRSSPPAYS
jgi:hypothetical protein